MYPGGSDGKEYACNARDPGSIPEATHSRILAWEIPRTEEPDRLHTVHEVTKSQTQLTTNTHTPPQDLLKNKNKNKKKPTN